MLNLITDAWIPMRMADGRREIIAPWQMAQREVVFPDWPRPDLNVACLELLIGLVFMACPPATVEDWDRGFTLTPELLREKLAPYAPAFNLLGTGPLFLQDLETFSGDIKPVDMLFIDSSGENAAKNNADLMVHRSRYPSLDLPLAAMALYTFQAFAPAGGAGNRTSMRGGGPLVTLVDPEADLWSLVWANMPEGEPAALADLPWMRATRLSDKDLKTGPPEGQRFGVEAFFGQPRRLRLFCDGEKVTGVIQKPWGTNYADWSHPLSPYYRMKIGEELLPKHPRAGRFGFGNWLGVLAREDGDSLTELAHCLRRWRSRQGGGSTLVAGWAMDNMKPRDFIFSRQPMVDLSLEDEDRLIGLIKAAELGAYLLHDALKFILRKGEAREAEREAYYLSLEPGFIQHFGSLSQERAQAETWLGELRGQALKQFDALALPGLDQFESDEIQSIVAARNSLNLGFAGYGKVGKSIFEALRLEVPLSKKGKAV